MAVELGTNEALYIDQAVVTAFPFTMACWFYAYSLATNQPCMWVGDKTSDIYLCRTQANAASNQFMARVEKHATSTYRTGYAASWTKDIWQHGAGVFDGPNSVQAYVNGAAGAEQTATSGVPAGYDRTALGCGMGLTPYYGARKDLAYAAIWSAAQTPAVIADLAVGVCPLKYPDNLEAFWPLGGEYGENYLDRSGNGHDLTAVGTPAFVADPPLLPYRLPFGVQKSQVFGW